MKKNILFTLIVLTLFSCSKKNEVNSTFTNKLLILKVDYLTNTFEGGRELRYSTNTPTFTITTEYQSPLDFGNIKLKYQELDEIIFDGDIIWMGKGKIKIPEKFSSVSTFSKLSATNITYSTVKFENLINNYGTQTKDYTTIWNAIKKLSKVVEYLNSNPNRTIKLFLYTPSVGLGNPADWDWIIFVKN